MVHAVNETVAGSDLHRLVSDNQSTERSPIHDRHLDWRSTMSPDETSQIAVEVEQRGSILQRSAIGGDPDAMLVELGRKFEALSGELAALLREEVDSIAPVDSRGERLEHGATGGSSTERVEAVLRLLDPIERSIMAIPAVTVVGLGVKARHAAHVLSHYWTDSPDRLDWDARTVRLLIESACTVAGVGLLSQQ
jgi:hypothetical protein